MAELDEPDVEELEPSDGSSGDEGEEGKAQGLSGRTAQLPPAARTQLGVRSRMRGAAAPPHHLVDSTHMALSHRAAST